jgi:acetyl-CoA synthetase
VCARNPHELLELAKAFGYGRRTSAPGTMIMTCSGGDAAAAADEAARLGVDLPPPSAATAEALMDVLPPTAVPANPLDYTAVIFGELEPTARLLELAGSDEAVGAVLVFYDRPAELDPDAAVSWDGALAGITAGAARLAKPVIVASTLPELLPEPTAQSLVDAGMIPIAGLSEGVLAAAALATRPGDPARLRRIAAAAATAGRSAGGTGRWLAEHEAKDLLRAAGVAVPPGAAVSTVEEAVAVADRLGGPVAVKLSRADLRHKSDIGGVHPDVSGESAVRAAVAAVRSIPGHADSPLLIEAMAPPGVELMVSVRRDGVVPVLVVALGGVWVELLDDAVIMALPVEPAALRRRLTGLRGSGLLTGGRGQAPVDLDAVVALAVAVAAVALAEGLDLVELNPVLAGPRGASAVDAVIHHGG